MSELGLALDRLVAEHDGIGSPLRDELRPGLSPEPVVAVIRSLGLTPPRELVELHSWHDLQRRPTTREVDWFWPVGGYRLDEAVDVYRRSVEIGGVTYDEIGDGLDPDQPPTATFTGFWRTDWFPVLGSTETYAIECPDGGSSPGAIWRVNWHPDVEFQTMRIAPSLVTLIDAAVDLFRSGAYRWDPAHAAIVTVDEVFEARGLTQYRPPILPLIPG